MKDKPRSTNDLAAAKEALMLEYWRLAFKEGQGERLSLLEKKRVKRVEKALKRLSRGGK